MPILKGKILEAHVTNGEVEWHAAAKEGCDCRALVWGKSPYEEMKAHNLQTGAPIKVEIEFDPAP